ncbi:RNA-binding protein [Vibrio sp. S4M6]|uniref:RNA recognition motif domain-containing protein n=1 Tax=Vibrio sinus TaxID=2946865 RepID=UPI002029F2AB|nr:RNA-binding protein [Vibrio sinus]MCL9780921.1 RNA-binding protein [Vibrio sinus]
MKLLVRNLARTTTEQEVRVLFSAHGTVTQCNLVLDQETGQSKGFAFLEMPDENEAKAALNSLNLTNVAKSKIRVKYAQS